MADLLQIVGLKAGYGPIAVLHGIDMRVAPGEMVALIGSNGAGKSTLMRALSGIATISSGFITMEGHQIESMPAALRVGRGLIHVPEGRRLFRSMTVEDNLMMGAYRLPRGASTRQALEDVYTIFPKLRERSRQDASTLSGGEQQMCAIGRGLMAKPRLLLIDELSLGLSPKLVEELAQALQRINETGLSVLLVEQDVSTALRLSSRAYVMDQGRISHDGPSADLASDPRVRAAYLGTS